MIKTIIIDDEQHSIETLKWKIENYLEEVVIQATFTDPEQGLNYLKIAPLTYFFWILKCPC